MKNIKSMSKKQRVVYESIKKFISNGTVPTVREICEDTGLSSTSTVHSHLRTLERKGYISRDKKHRSLKIVGTEPTTAVPVIDGAKAGTAYTLEDISGYVPVLASKAAGKELFALKVSGESMKGIGILDGDIAVCEKKDSAQNGEIIVARVGGETTVRTFYRDDESGKFRLQPQNLDFVEPVIADEIEILGKVISLYREF